MRILLVDGYSVDWVCSGREAESALSDAQAAYEIVLLDWVLPGRSGVEVLRHIRRAGNNIPVLMITARDAISNRVIGLDDGACSSPYGWSSLSSARLRQCLSNAKPSSVDCAPAYTSRRRRAPADHCPPGPAPEQGDRPCKLDGAHLHFCVQIEAECGA